MSFAKWFKKKQHNGIEEDAKFVDDDIVHATANGHGETSSSSSMVKKSHKLQNATTTASIGSATTNGKKSVKFESVNGDNYHYDNGEIYANKKNDFLPLETALLLIADEQPVVARSTPRGQPYIDNHWAEEREMRYCLFDRPVYDAMIQSSLKAVELLQENLDDFVTEVRKSPSRDTTPRANGTNSNLTG